MIKTLLYYIIALSCISMFSVSSHAKIMDYELNIAEQPVNISGKETTALTLNGSIPGPTLKAKVGDILRVKVTNNLDADTSIHWHGVLVPNNMDGVPYITQPPIKPGEVFVYEFPVRHSGTYWYHAHSALQEQQGIYGSLVFYPAVEGKDYDEEYVIVLSDWTNESPEQVLANIKKDPDYYALKKDSVQSWLKVLENGSGALKIRLNNAWTRMGPMDMSDIGYDAFLINGRASSVLSHAKPGTRAKLRIINAAASSYFIFEYSGGAMKVIEADGVKVEPFTAQRVRIAMAETYDVIITIPDSKTYEFRASAEDGTGYAVAHIGHGGLVPAPIYPKPNLVLMDMSNVDHGGMDHASMSGHNMSDMKMPMSGNVSHSTMNMSSMLNMGHLSHNHNQSPAKPTLDKPTLQPKKEEKMVHDMQDHSMHQGMNMPTVGDKEGQAKNATTSTHDMKAMEGMDHSTMKGMQGAGYASMVINKEKRVHVDKPIPHIDYVGNYKHVRSLFATTLPKEHPTRIVTLRLTGSMERYVWTINDTPMYAADEITIKKGENVKFVLVNETMMNHPIHLHGHFFRVLNGHGDYSPLKHTVSVAPFETVEIEFEANAEKDWIFHCHNLYHMKLGMGGIVHYEGTQHDPAFMDHDNKHASEHGNMWFNAIKIESYSNFALGIAKFMRNNDNFILDLRHNYKRDYEGELIYQRYVSQFLGLYAGGKVEREDDEVSNRGILGVEYTLPLLVKADLRINTNGKLRFGLGNEHQLTNRLSFEWRWNTDKEYTLELHYTLTKQLYMAGNYDSRERFGLGLALRL